MGKQEKERFHPDDLTDWNDWLRAHHGRNDGVWLVNYKKPTGKQTFTFEQAIDIAVCWGWIDSKPAKLDNERSMLWFAPRKKRSGWSRINKQRAERLIAEGQMQQPGLSVVEAAKADGSWNVLDDVENLVIPTDLAEAFEGYAGSAENFAQFPRSARRGILEWIHSARRPDTRRKRIDETARLAQINERANSWPRSGS